MQKFQTHTAIQPISIQPLQTQQKPCVTKVWHNAEKHSLFTRMHSSRMCTAHSSSRWGVCLLRGWLLPGGCLLPGDASLPGGLPARQGVCLLPGGLSQEGGASLLGVSLLGDLLPREVSLMGDSPVNRMTNRCKNITLPQTSFAGGKYISLSQFISFICPM